MAWQDRPYYRDRSSSPMNPLLWLLGGSVPLFTAFGIRVRAHASLVLYVAIVLILGLGRGFGLEDKVVNITLLFTIVLLHEFGHCFAARRMGGFADDVLMTPLGGLAFAHPPRRPWATFVTVAAGPLVNVLICLVSGMILYAGMHWLPRNPFYFSAPLHPFGGWIDPWRYVFWTYQISLMLLIFNLLPIYPLDGGQIVQTMLWPKLGFFRSTLISCVVGMVGSILGVIVAMAQGIGGIFMAILFLSLFMYCLSYRRQLLAIGPEEFADETDYSAAYEQPTPRTSSSKLKRRRKVSRRLIKKARKKAEQAMLEQQRIDAILAKVSAHGMVSLTWLERRALHKATERQRKRDLEISKLG